MPEDVPRVLVDTNVWISAFINAEGAPAQVLGAFLQGRFVPVISQALLNEIREVFSRPRIRQRLRSSDDDANAILVLLQDRGAEAFPTGSLHLCRDPEDDFIVETAILGRAHFAVSRDDDLKRDQDLIAHLRGQAVEVLSVAQFLRMLDTH